jgi:FkbM family methyltransferase
MYAPGDPRWDGEETTALYPSARLFRQPTAGDWKSVIEQVAFELRPHGADLHSLPNTASPLDCGPSVPRRREPGVKPAPPPLLLNAPCKYGRMSFHPNDHYIGRALHLYGEYSESEAELLNAALQPGDTVIEAGANIGGLTAAIAARVGPGGSVLAFEPQPHYFALLNYNLGGRENVTVREEALGATQETIEIDGIFLDRVHAPGWAGGGRTHLVFQTTIDELSVDPSLIKIDVDGQELDILKGAEATIQRARPFLYVENDKPAQYPDLLPWIEAHGYRIYQHYAPLFSPRNYAGYPVNVFGKIVSAMIFCVPKERYLARDFPERFGLQRLA